ncbi:MAG: hypothetical protein EOQ28_33220 [Mesorhizobium sp.]|nr:MAG: hypothetical protein EOQ28_33220 [Mesorhizobium sp.]RWB93226.1 MAG: hypothetical protein EOQ57_34630 [Mesorhizobium sp.]
MTTAVPLARYGAVEGALASGFITAELHHLAGVRHAKLMIACGCKSHPAKAVAGKPGPSLAGVAATRGLKCRQESCGVRE